MCAVDALGSAAGEKRPQIFWNLVCAFSCFSFAWRYFGVVNAVAAKVQLSAVWWATKDVAWFLLCCFQINCIVFVVVFLYEDIYFRFLVIFLCFFSFIIFHFSF